MTTTTTRDYSYTPSYERSLQKLRSLSTPLTYVHEQAQAAGLGWLPVLCFVAALGFVAIVAAYTEARFSKASWISALYWGGLLTIYLPIALRLCLARTSRRERVGLLLLLTLGLYLFKISLSPNFLYLSDEFTHWRSTINILKTHQLFQINPILPTSAYYPGLHNVSAAFAQLSGLSVFHTSLLVIGATRIVLNLALFLAFERASGSARVAGIACLIYAGNPNFIFYGQQFGYESLSLPLAALVLMLLIKRNNAEDTHPLYDLNFIIALLILAIIPTHHMTSYALSALLTAWVAVNWLDKRGWLGILDRCFRWAEGTLKLLARFPPLRWLFNQLHLFETPFPQYIAPPHRPTVVVFMLLAIGATVVWLVSVATITIGYLSPVLGGAIEELVNLISGEIGAKETFKAVKGFQAPAWERFISFGAVGLILLGLPLGWLQTWKQQRLNLPSLLLVIASLLYPVTLAMRMTEKGSETANRSSEFLFIAIGFVLAFAIVNLFFRHGLNPLRLGIVLVYMTILFMGGNITGQAWWARLPGDYVVGGDTLAIQPESMKAAERVALVLGRGNRVIADGLNLKMMGSYGQQIIQRRLSWTFFSKKTDAPVQEAWANNNIGYVVIDWRITRYLPINGHYFESNEPNADRHTEPFDPASLAKYDADPRLSRIFDSGNIQIYDVSYYRDNYFALHVVPKPPSPEIKRD